MVYQPYLRSQECLPLARASIKIDNHYHMNLDASAIVDWYCYSGVVALVPLSWVVGGGRGGVEIKIEDPEGAMPQSKNQAIAKAEPN